MQLLLLAIAAFSVPLAVAQTPAPPAWCTKGGYCTTQDPCTKILTIKKDEKTDTDVTCGGQYVWMVACLTSGSVKDYGLRGEIEKTEFALGLAGEKAPFSMAVACVSDTCTFITRCTNTDPNPSQNNESTSPLAPAALGAVAASLFAAAAL